MTFGFGFCSVLYRIGLVWVLGYFLLSGSGLVLGKTSVLHGSVRCGWVRVLSPSLA